jgi:hypothetical protein
VSFDEPFVNRRGDVTFNAVVSEVPLVGVPLRRDQRSGSVGVNGVPLELRGVFLRRGTQIEPIVVPGEELPGLGTIATMIDGPTFNNRSSVACVVATFEEVPITAIVQKKTSTTLFVVAKEGDVAVGTGGAVFAGFDDLAMNDHDDLAFIASYTRDGGATLEWGVFYTRHRRPVLAVVRSGDVLPGTGGARLAAELPDGPWINQDGDVAFVADVTTGGSGDFHGSAFLRRRGRRLERLVLRGDRVPPPVNRRIESVAAGRPALNDTHFAFLAVFGGVNEDPTIVRKRIGGGSTVLLRSGQAAPGTLGTFTNFAGPAMNARNVVCVEADVEGDSTVTRGIWVVRGTEIRPVALEGDAKPGGGTYGNDISDASISDNGRVAFIDETSPRGVFVTPRF